MGDYQPRNSDTIRVDYIREKSTSHGISFPHPLTLNATTNFVGAIDLATTAAPINAVYSKAFQVSGAAVRYGSLTAHDVSFVSANVVRMQLMGAVSGSTQAGRLQKRLGDTGFTSGGEIEEFTANVTTTSVTPVTLFTYTISQLQTQVTLEVHLVSRDSVAGTGSHIVATVSGSRAASTAVAGTVGTIALANATALQTLTVTASGNDLQVKAQNASGSNTTYGRAFIRAYPISLNT